MATTIPYRPTRPMRGQPGYRARQAFIDNKRKPAGFTGFGTVATTATGVSAGATIGSAVPVVGTAIGAVIGGIIGSLIKTGKGAQREAIAVQLDNAIAQIPSGNGIGRQIPWNENNHGLQQMIQGLMTSQVYMAWDSGLQSPSINAAWALYFIAGIRAVTAAIIKGATGARLTVAIPTLQSGYGRPGSFTFNNPGVAVGADVIAAKIIMGNGGLMYWMMINQDTVPVNQAQENANNGAAQKVFSLMVDHTMADLGVPWPIPAPVAVKSSAVPAKASIQPVVVSTAAPAVTVTGTTASGSPIVAPDDTSALIQAMMAQGASQSQATQAAIASLEANGVDTSQPAVQAQIASDAAPGISTSTMLLIGAALVGGYLLLK